jgi:signal transduction histidine kinase
MDQKLKNIQNSFILSIVALAVLSVISLGAVLYATNAIDIRKNVTSSELHQLTENFPAVESYLQSQKNAEPHFIKIANLVKSDQQALLGRALFYTGIPILLFSGLLAYFLARKLVRPVEKTFSDQERFLQDASHEMRNPLAALYAVVQDARSSESPKDKDKALDTIDRQVKQLVKLNDDLLLIERSKQKTSNLTSINVSDLTLDVIDSVYAQANQRRIQLKKSIEQNVLIPYDDKDWVCIVRNIIENAIKYSPDKSKIAISLNANKANIVFTVKDSGIGIPESEITNLGDRFYRGKNVGRIGGTGLGLAIVYQIVHKYQGSIDISSKLQKGTTVTIKLPKKK